MTKIKEIQAKGKKAEKGELGGIIDALKVKRDKLDNFISIAEMMNETGMSFKDLKNVIINVDNIKADDIFDILGEISSLGKCVDMEDDIVDDILSDDDYEEVFSHFENIIDCLSRSIDFKDEVVQTEVRNIHKILSKVLSGSVYLLRIMITFFEVDGEIVEDLDEKTKKYVVEALRYYCDANKDNPTDKGLDDAFNNIEKLARNKYTIDCEEVQNEIRNIHMFFDKIEILKPKIRTEYVKNIGRLFGSQAYKNVIDNGAQRGISWFISRAIEIYFKNLERENIYGEFN